MTEFNKKANALSGVLSSQAECDLPREDVDKMLRDATRKYREDLFVPVGYTPLEWEIVRVAQGNLGFGEKEANNDGPLIREIGGKPGQEWCALFAGYCYEKAHTNLGLKLPFARSIGAKRLTKNAAKVGSFFTDPLKARPGDLVCWHRRTGLISWKGHVGVVSHVEDDLVHTIEGNVGAFPAKVKRLVHDVRKERLYGFATLRKGVA